MKRSYYSNYAKKFVAENDDKILGELVKNHVFNLNDLQKNAWIQELEILKNLLRSKDNVYICLEYSIPRMGKRVDAILIIRNIIVVIEFKIGSDKYLNADIDQALDYALDLKNFHEQSHNKIILPVLVSTEAENIENDISKYNDDIYRPIKLNKHNTQYIFTCVDSIDCTHQNIDFLQWVNSIYKPTPTIIQAAQALYNGHNVSEISRSDAHTHNLQETSNEILNALKHSKINSTKSICFITGVPGAGKL